MQKNIAEIMRLNEVGAVEINMHEELIILSNLCLRLIVIS
jgi:hypothetical protein